MMSEILLGCGGDEIFRDAPYGVGVGVIRGSGSIGGRVGVILGAPDGIDGGSRHQRFNGKWATTKMMANT